MEGILMPRTKARSTEANQLSWNVNELLNQNKKGNVDFSVPIQRGYVWDNRRCSLLIHSICLGIPISEFYFNRTENGKYEGLEGKQRNRALCDFVNNQYKLHANTPTVTADDGTEVVIARHTFDKLPPEIQNRIRMFPLRIFWFDNASVADKILIFTRINSGKPVTIADIARIKVLSRDIFVSLCDHQAITTIVREKSKSRLVDEDIVEDIWLLANVENPSLLNRYRASVLEFTEVTDEQHEELKKTLDYMLAFYQSVESDKKLFTKLRAKTHITSLGYMGALAVRNQVPVDAFIDRATAFFSPGDAKTTASDTYNQASVAGSSKPEQVKIRMEEIAKALGL
jgi:hypothetical protein